MSRRPIICRATAAERDAYRADAAERKARRQEKREAANRKAREDAVQKATAGAATLTNHYPAPVQRPAAPPAVPMTGGLLPQRVGAVEPPRPLPEPDRTDHLDQNAEYRRRWPRSAAR